MRGVGRDDGRVVLRVAPCIATCRSVADPHPPSAAGASSRVPQDPQRIDRGAHQPGRGGHYRSGTREPPGRRGSCAGGCTAVGDRWRWGQGSPAPRWPSRADRTDSQETAPRLGQPGERAGTARPGRAAHRGITRAVLRRSGGIGMQATLAGQSVEHPGDDRGVDTEAIGELTAGQGVRADSTRRSRSASIIGAPPWPDRSGTRRRRRTRPRPG